MKKAELIALANNAHLTPEELAAARPRLAKLIRRRLEKKGHAHASNPDLVPFAQNGGLDLFSI